MARLDRFSVKDNPAISEKDKPIDNSISFIDGDSLLIKSLDTYWANFIRQLTACQENASVESVHDIRVATRRLLTFFELIQIAAPIKQIAGMQGELKLLRKHFDALRDIQVIIIEIAGLDIKIAGIKDFLTYLRRRELKHKAEVAVDVCTYKVLKNTRKLNIAREKLLKQSTDNGKMERKVLRYLDDSYQLVNKRMRKLDPEAPLTFHAVRIACRKFRYQVEACKSLFLEYPADNMTLLKSFQDKFGEIQNHEVMYAILLKYARKHPECSVEEIKAYLEKKLMDAIQTIMTEDTRTEQLWRASPRSGFPWGHGARSTALREVG